MPANTVLIIEDDEVARRTAERSLGKHGFTTLTATSGEDGLSIFAERNPAAVILDRGLPDIDGLEVCKRIRAMPGGSSVPIILVTAQDDNDDIVEGLDAGADDYVTKPFNSDVLASRIRAILRRSTAGSEAAAAARAKEDDDLIVEEEEPIVHIHGQEIHLDPLQHHILRVFYESRGMILGHYDLFEATRSFDAGTTHRDIELSIDSLRELFAPYGNYLEHVVGIGYRLRD